MDEHESYFSCSSSFFLFLGWGEEMTLSLALMVHLQRDHGEAWSWDSFDHNPYHIWELGSHGHDRFLAGCPKWVTKY